MTPDQSPDASRSRGRGRAALRVFLAAALLAVLASLATLSWKLGAARREADAAGRAVPPDLTAAVSGGDASGPAPGPAGRPDAALIVDALSRPVVARYRRDNPGDVLRDLTLQTGVVFHWSGRLRYAGEIAFDPTPNPFSMDVRKGTVALKEVIDRLAAHFGVTPHSRVLHGGPEVSPEVVIAFWREAPDDEIDALKRGLAAGDVQARCRAAADLAVDSCPAKVRLLYARLLAEPDPAVRHWLERSAGSAMPLGFCPPDREQTAQFLQLLKSDDVRRVATALRVLAAAGEPVPVSSVLEALKAEDDRCWAAMEYVGARRLPQALPRLEELLGRDPWWWGASGALIRYDSHRAIEALLAAAGEGNQAAIWRLQDEPHRIERAKAVALLAGFMNEHPHYMVRIGAACSLGYLARVEPAAFEALRDAKTPWALQGIGLARDPRSLGILTQAARKGSPAEAASACRGLAVLRPADESAAFGIMEEAWKRTGEEIKVSKNIVVSMAMMSGPRVTERMLEMAEDPRPDVAQRALTGLIRVPGETARAAIRAGLKHEDPDMIHCTILCLAERAGAGRIDFLSGLAAAIHPPRVRAVATRALAETGRPEAVPVLIAAARDPDGEVRAGAAKAMGWVGDPRAVPALLAALDEKDDGVRAAAAEALERFSYLPEVRRRLEKKLPDEF